MVEAPVFLGINVERVVLIPLGSSPFEWNFEKKDYKSSFIVSQSSWKKTIEKPSGPGALSLGSSLVALLIPSIVKSVPTKMHFGPIWLFLSKSQSTLLLRNFWSRVIYRS